MARFSSSSCGNLRTRLSSCAEYLEAVAELRTKLLHSSPSFLISDPEKLISLVEVAKSTLQNSGVSLHTFSSCPGSLSAHKSAYFGLLLQVQAHSYNSPLESKDLQGRLNRLLFPLSTQLRVCTKAAEQAAHSGYATQACGVKHPGNCDATEKKPAPLGPETSSISLSCPESSDSISRLRSRTPTVLPPNAMLPPPSPVRRVFLSDKSSNSRAFISSKPALGQSNRKSFRHLDEARSARSKRRKVSQDTVHFKRRNGETLNLHDTCTNPPPRLSAYDTSMRSSSGVSPSPHEDNSGEVLTDEDGSAESSSDSDDSDSDSMHVVVPPHSPLRRSLGIFCTGKGRGAYSGTVPCQRRRAIVNQEKVKFGLQRGPGEVFMDTDA